MWTITPKAKDAKPFKCELEPVIRTETGPGSRLLMVAFDGKRIRRFPVDDVTVSPQLDALKKPSKPEGKPKSTSAK